MKKYKITFYAPYTFANFECEAETYGEAYRKKEADHLARGYCIMDREIKSEKFDGKKV